MEEKKHKVAGWGTYAFTEEEVKRIEQEKRREESIKALARAVSPALEKKGFGGLAL
jgi:predicted GNAT family acetyltransferase